MSWPSTWMTDSHMTFHSYISDPDIAFNHINELVARALQYQIFYPTPKNLDQAAFEAHYDQYLNDDLINLTEEMYYWFSKGVPMRLTHDSDDEEIDEPACGDCGGCHKCLGDPPDTRWDTTYEKNEEYLETHGL